MQQSIDSPVGQPIGTRPERPPNYLVRAIILLLLLAPLCLLVGGSSLFTAWSVLTGPPVRSETPVWMRAFMEFLRVIVALIGLYLPLRALVEALKVNSEFDIGNYAGAVAASKSAVRQCRQALILLVLILMIMAVDLVVYLLPD